MNEWGIPDWRDPAAYGDVKRWTFNRWRWEFYRRRDDLRACFDARADETYRINLQKVGFDWAPVAHLRPDEPGFCAIVDVETRARFGYSGLPNPRIGEQWEDRLNTFENDGTLKTVDGGFSGRDGAADTIGERLKDAGVTLTEAQKRRLRYVLACHLIELGQDEFALGFNLNRPLKPQLANARVVLQWHYEMQGKPMQRRRHPVKWLGYLRALDAREADASWAEIADLFHAQGLLGRRKDPAGGYCAPPPQAARDMWEAANALRFNF